LPTPQGVHVEPPNVTLPGGHTPQEEVPALEKRPGEQATHATVDRLENLPALHGVQDEAPVKVSMFVTLPGVHTLHDVDPEEEE